MAAGIEQHWRTRFGTEAVRSLLDALQPAALGAPSDRMPWSPSEVHPSDGFSTHVVDGPTDEATGVCNRLGQALTALILEHEQGSEVSLPKGANVLRVIDAGSVKIRDLPRLAGISKESVAMATKYLERKGLGQIQPRRSITLTAAGQNAARDYRERAAQLRNSALRASLNGILSQREALAAGLVPADGGRRASMPWLAQTQRILADPIGGLPWHPMVLHRGGWPDGS